MFRAIAMLVAAAALAAGGQEFRPAPALKVPLVNGKDFDLATHRGQVIALTLVYTTCPHCQRAARVLDKLYRQYRREGFEVLAVACNSGADLLAEEFAERLDLSFPVGIGDNGLIVELMSGVSRRFQLPGLLVIDRRGMIRAIHTGEQPFFTGPLEANLREAIVPLLKERRPARRAKGR